MSELNAKARALLSSARYADEPTQADYERVHTALEARIAVGLAVGVAVTLGADAVASGATSTTVAGTAAVTTSGAAASTGVAAGVAAKAVVAGASVGASAAVGAGASAPVAAAAGGAVLGKVAAWAALAGVLAVGSAAVATHPFSDASRAGAIAPQRSSLAVRAAVARSAGATDRRSATVAREPLAPLTDSLPAVPPPAAGPAQGTEDLPVAVPHASAARASAGGELGRGLPVARPVDGARSSPTSRTPASTTVEPVSAPSSIDVEIALLRDARQALRAGSADHALELLDESAQRFPDGALAEDRAAERIFALCALGRGGDAAALAGRFLSDHPRSPYAAAVRASCGGATKN